MKLLIIDDDEVDRSAVVRAMQKSNFEVAITEADTAEKGLALAKESVFDVVLLDVLLPDRNGIEVLLELRKASNNVITVVMFSHQDDVEVAQRAINAGAEDFLLKSEVSARHLVRALLQASQRHRLEEELRSSNERLRLLAERDALTQLANRYEFERSLNLAVSRSQRGENCTSLLLLDIDHFKNVNDTYGHDIGDQLLIDLAQRLQKVVRGGDLLARLGGDEFAILLQDVENDQRPVLLANRIIQAFSLPFIFGDKQLIVTTSIGIASIEDCAQDAVVLLKCADIAMYRAKSEGRNQWHFYSDQLNEEVRARIALEADLRAALESNQFKLHYQAKIDAESVDVVGVEALLRWEHPDRGLVSPALFINQLEDMGLMPAVGQWVLNTACQQLQAWRTRLPLLAKKLTMAVNISATQMQGPDFVSAIEAALAATGLPPDRLELEITEGTLIKNPEVIAALLNEVAAHGVRLALDDFGTGYSSFEHLRLFPIHRLKIDQTFVRNIGRNASQDLLLKAMVSFGKALGLVIIAEGTETAEHVAVCRALGCDILQGYYFSKPVSAEEFEATFLKP